MFSADRLNNYESSTKLAKDLSCMPEGYKQILENKMNAHLVDRQTRYELYSLPEKITTVSLSKLHDNKPGKK